MDGALRKTAHPSNPLPSGAITSCCGFCKAVPPTPSLRRAYLNGQVKSASLARSTPSAWAWLRQSS